MGADGGLASILTEGLMPEKMIQKTGFDNIDVILSGGRKMKEFEDAVFKEWLQEICPKTEERRRETESK